jgi:hypothetical protein
LGKNAPACSSSSSASAVEEKAQTTTQGGGGGDLLRARSVLRAQCVHSVGTRFWTDLSPGDHQRRYGDAPCVFSMKASLRCKFAECLDPEELKPSYDLRQSFDVAFAAAVMLNLLSVEMTERAERHLLLQPWDTKSKQKKETSVWFVPSDFSFSGPVVKTIHLADFSNGLALLLSGPIQTHRAAAKRLTESSLEMLQSAHSKAPLCPMILSKYGVAVAQRSWFSKNPEVRMLRSVELLELAMQYAPDWDLPIRHLRDVLAVLLARRLGLVQLKNRPTTTNLPEVMVKTP